MRAIWPSPPSFSDSGSSGPLGLNCKFQKIYILPNLRGDSTATLILSIISLAGIIAELMLASLNNYSQRGNFIGVFFYIKKKYGPLLLPI